MKKLILRNKEVNASSLTKYVNAYGKCIGAASTFGPTKNRTNTQTVKPAIEKTIMNTATNKTATFFDKPNIGSYNLNIGFNKLNTGSYILNTGFNKSNTGFYKPNINFYKQNILSNQSITNL